MMVEGVGRWWKAVGYGLLFSAPALHGIIQRMGPHLPVKKGDHSVPGVHMCAYPEHLCAYMQTCMYMCAHAEVCVHA